MIGTLLEDLTAGLPFAQIKAKFDAKMDALNYQRPAAAPAAGNIARAEKIIAKLKTEGSLDRRFARLDEIQKLWVPASSKGRREERCLLSSQAQAEAVCRRGRCAACRDDVGEVRADGAAGGGEHRVLRPRGQSSVHGHGHGEEPGGAADPPVGLRGEEEPGVLLHLPWRIGACALEPDAQRLSPRDRRLFPAFDVG